MITNFKDVGSTIKIVACGGSNGVAAGTGDNTAVTGATIDRKEAGATGFNTCVLAYAYKAIQAGATTFSVAIAVQESADGSAWDTAVALQASTDTGAAGTATTTAVVKLRDVGFANRKRYVRYNHTPDLSAGAADTFVGHLVAVLGGPDALPVA